MKKRTIIAFVVAITAVFAVSATGNEWSLYGDTRVATFYTSQDLGKDLELVSPNTFIAVDARDSANQSTVKDLNWNLQTNSRIGATVTGDRLDARFEFGVTSDGGGGNVDTRRLYATWKFTGAGGSRSVKTSPRSPSFFPARCSMTTTTYNIWAKPTAPAEGNSRLKENLGPVC